MLKFYFYYFCLEPSKGQLALTILISPNTEKRMNVFMICESELQSVLVNSRCNVFTLTQPNYN